MSPHAPLLLLVWRRQKSLRQVIDAIRPSSPSRLFVACDGPSLERKGEAEKVAATRLLIEQEVDWHCQLEYLYSDFNQGCRIGVSRAISWFFEQVEEGIILEDDCVPHKDFIPFCSQLLELYRDNPAVWQISGFNPLPSRLPNNKTHQYIFTSYGSIWGWATWRRCWQFYDRDLLRSWASGSIGEAVAGLEKWEKPENRLAEALQILDGFDTWDYQWFFARLIHKGISIVPTINLITNIGFTPDAAHTLNKQNFIPLLSREEIRYPIQPVSAVVVDKAYDKQLIGWQYRARPNHLLAALRNLYSMFFRRKYITHSPDGLEVPTSSQDLWKSKRFYRDSWIRRNNEMALLLSAQLPHLQSVAVFGCGPSQPMENSLAQLMPKLNLLSYDLRSWNDSVRVLDLNKSSIKHVPHVDCLVFSGVLEFVDLVRIFEDATSISRFICFSYSPLERPRPKSLIRRLTDKILGSALDSTYSFVLKTRIESGFKNHLTIDSLVHTISKYGFPIYASEFQAGSNQVFFIIQQWAA
jgi:hypothetical protein